MKRPAWKDIPSLWYADGSLRDIYLLNTNLADWKALITFVTRYQSNYFCDGEENTLPSADAFFQNRDHHHMLRIDIAGATVNCHFFITSEIELDIAPYEIQSAEVHDEILSFIEALATTIGKEALLTPENESDRPYLSFSPLTQEWKSC